jgi:hypothetical protein
VEGEAKVRGRMLFIAAVVAPAAVFVFGGTAQAGKPGTGAIRGATLTGAQVVPSGGDPDGTGEARFIFYPNKHKICYTIQVSDIARATSATCTRPPRARLAP